jgi:Icc-related predicted phosphoesterase
VKIQIMSDLHIAHWGTAMGVNYWSSTFPQETQTDADVLILAGDIVDLRQRDWRWSMARLQEFAVRYKHVVYVPGNHEFYGRRIRTLDYAGLEQESGVNVLRPGKAVEINGQRFLGGVMFQPHFDPANGEALLGYETAQEISDSWCIDDFARGADADYWELRSWLEAELKPKDIVVTHHAPSTGSLDQQWVGHPCNYFFITSHIEPLLNERQPKMWVHGHVHTPFDYKQGQTRVIANPKGYPNEGVRFNPKFVVES